MIKGDIVLSQDKNIIDLAATCIQKCMSIQETEKIIPYILSYMISAFHCERSYVFEKDAEENTFTNTMNSVQKILARSCISCRRNQWRLFYGGLMI